LKESIVIIKLVVLLAYSFDPVEDGNEGFLESLCVSITRLAFSYCEVLPFQDQPLHLLSSSFPDLIDIFTGTSWAHGSYVVRAKVTLNGANVRAVARNGKRPAASAAGQARAHRNRLVDDIVIAVVGVGPRA
jgi:hypothetical protein